MSDSKHIILYSHGFGVDKTGRGLFTDIAASLLDAEHIMFDYNQYDQDGNMKISPLNEQVETLTEQLDELPSDQTIDIIAHSQGCIVTALAKPAGVRRVILLAPPTRMDKDRMLAWFAERDGAEINPKGVTRLPRRDGSLSIITSDYWKSIEHIDVINAYQELARQHNVTIIRAAGDEVVGETDFNDIKDHVTLMEIQADHNFTGPARDRLCQEIKDLLGA